MIQRLEKISGGIASFLAKRLREHSGFGARSFYGETYSLLLLFQTGVLDDGLKEILISEYEKKDKSENEFHWEFNNFAMMEYRRASRDESLSAYLTPLRFRNISVTNWTLLRDLVKIVAGTEKKTGIEEAGRILEKRQLRSGFILDEPKVRSFQYHCFSTALLGQISFETGLSHFVEGFQKAVSFIRSFILSNGDTNYVGRGQEQSFGYGALLYSLALSYSFTRDPEILSEINLVLGRIEAFQRADGSFPLVLNLGEKGVPVQVNPLDAHFPGWYPYNNYFDYLPFFGSYIWKTKELLEKAGLREFSAPVSKPYRDNYFQKIVTKNYEAVLAKCGGYWTNDLPMPYLVGRGGTLTPCYGGEQFQDSIYDLSGIPIPQWGPWFTSFRRLSIHRFSENRMTFLSPGSFVQRDFEFNESGFRIETRVYSPFKIRHLYLFPQTFQLTGDSRALESPELKVVSDSPFEYLGTRYSASGALVLYGVSVKNNTLAYELNP